METLREERVVMTVLRTFEEFIRRELGIRAIIEAFGPSLNEGYCYESAFRSSFAGAIQGEFVFAMDGYTRLKVLSRLGEWYYDTIDHTRTDASTAQKRFLESYVSELTTELDEADLSSDFSPAEDVSQKLIPLDLTSHRQFIMIYFLKDLKEKTYLGRFYIVMSLSIYEKEKQSSGSPGEEDQKGSSKYPG